MSKCVCELFNVQSLRRGIPVSHKMTHQHGPGECLRRSSAHTHGHTSQPSEPVDTFFNPVT